MATYGSAWPRVFGEKGGSGLFEWFLFLIQLADKQQFFEILQGAPVDTLKGHGR